MGVTLDTDGISHLQTVPKNLVHKWGLDQVFVTGYEAQGTDETLLGATLPRSHGFYCEFPLDDRTPDLALVIEVCRQACFVVAHTQFGVPLAGNRFQFLLKELSGQFADTAPLRRPGPIDLTVTCRIERVWRRRSEVSGLVWAFTVRAGDAVVATVRMRQTWIERDAWREMRRSLRTGRGLPPETAFPTPPASRLSPAEVGRVNPANVVLDDVAPVAGGFSATVRADLRHPVLFDHPIDHLYAMVQMEACRQLSLLAVARRLGRPATELEMSAVAAEFVSVAEFDVPAVPTATVRPSPDGEDGRAGVPVDVVIGQRDRRVSTFALRVRPHSEPDGAR